MIVAADMVAVEPSPADLEAQAQEQARLDAAEAARIKRFEDDHRRPDDVKDVVDGMADDRDYVHTEANLPDTPGGVATNYLLRYQWIHSSQIYAKDPSISVKSKRKLGMLVPALQEMIDGLGKTVEYLVQHCANEGELRPIVDGMIQDTDTTGMVFLKVNWIEDLGRDPTGTFRPNDLVGQVRKLQRMREDFADGKFQATDAQYQEMTELAQCVQKEMEAEHWRQTAYPTQQMTLGPDGAPIMGDAGLPTIQDVPYPEGQDPRRLRWDGIPTPPQITELPRYRGFVFDVFDCEDVMWDWRIKRPELLHRGSHISTRVYMTAEKVRESYDVPLDDCTDYIPSGPTSGKQLSGATTAARMPSTPNGEEKHDGMVSVWERQCEDGYIYTWCEGAKKFLRKVKNEIATSARYNVFPLYFNRVTGRVPPVSNVTLGRPLQNEINTVRTHKRQAKRAAYNRYIAEKDLFDDDEKSKLERCPPEGIVFTKRPIVDIRNGLMPINGQFNAAVHDVSEEKQELSVAMNIPAAATGQTRGGSDSATEASIANQATDAMAGRHRSILESFLQRVFSYMAEVLVQALPEDNAKAIAGPGAIWPQMDREALWSHLAVEIEAGSTGKPDQQKRLDCFQQAMQVGQLMGIGANPMAPTWNYESNLRKLADIMDWRDDPLSLIQMPPPPMMVQPQGPPPAGAGPGGQPPGAQGPVIAEPVPAGHEPMPPQPGPQMGNPNHMAEAMPAGIV